MHTLSCFNGKTFGSEHGHRDLRTKLNGNVSSEIRLRIAGSVSIQYLLGFAATGVSNEKGTVELNKDFLDLLLGGLIDKLLVESNNGLGKSLTDGVDLRDVTCKENVQR